MTARRPARRGEARAWVRSLLERIHAGEDLGDECILWPFSTNRGSGGHYPQIAFNGRNMRVSRMLFEAVAGRPLEPGEVIRHSCDRMLCVNPWHFETGSQLDNVADMLRRNRQAAGERNGQARLTQAQVRDIRELAGEHDLRGSVSFVARSYGVSPSNITLVLAGKTWAGVP